jgi:short subunit dehydrogenase-like uncharacterized protein
MSVTAEGVMSKSWMIYGAYGFTGALAARVAKRRGERPLLAGRNREALEKLGRELDLPIRVFELSSVDAVTRQLADVSAILCCAGPFKRTVEMVLPACEKTGTHYIDITGELDVLEWVHERSDRFRRAKIVALPGAGFDVVPSDCLAARLARELPDAHTLRLGFKSNHGKMGPGTAKTMFDALLHGARGRRDGQIAPIPDSEMVARFAFEGSHEEPAVAVSWGDVSTAYHSTGIPNIQCFIGLDEKAIRGVKNMPRMKKVLGQPFVQKLVEKQIERFVKGPNESERRSGRMFLVGEVVGPDGLARTRVTLPDGAVLTSETAVTCTLRILRGEVKPGAQTPSRAFGAGFLEELADVKIETLRAPYVASTSIAH